MLYLGRVRLVKGKGCGWWSRNTFKRKHRDFFPIQTYSPYLFFQSVIIKEAENFFILMFCNFELHVLLLYYYLSVMSIYIEIFTFLWPNQVFVLYRSIGYASYRRLYHFVFRQNGSIVLLPLIFPWFQK